MKYGYIRVSTPTQRRTGSSLADQQHAVRAAGAEVVYSDAYTGAKLDRPNLAQLLPALRAGDELIVTKLDRLARSCVDGAQLIGDLQARGVMVNVLNIGRIDDTPIGRLIMQVLLAIAQFQRDMIVERTQAGKDAARAKGIRVDGRPPKYTADQIDHAMQLLDQGNSYSHVERLTGISVSTLVRARRKKK